jgi:heme A synthase
MKSIRRLSYLALAVAYAHLVFGAIVRISGSGMGCGDNWPKCYGHWFPPLDQPALVIEWTHRLLASLLLVALVSLAAGTWLRRNEPGVRGAAGVLRLAIAAPLMGLLAALLGAVTVFLGNPPYATVAHWVVAMGVIALVTAVAIRAGALGGDRARTERGTEKAARGAAFALIAVAMGGLTAKLPFGAVACTSFPLCGTNAAAPASSVQVQITHRVFALLLLLHLFGTVMAMRRREESSVVRQAALVALALVVAQIGVAASMVLFHLPPVLRSLHEAVGVLIWIACFAFWYLARRAMHASSTSAVAGPVEGPVIAQLAEPPKVAAPTESPAHSMAVIIARGADI